MEENQENMYFDRSFKKDRYPEGYGDQNMSNNVKCCLSSKTTGLLDLVNRR